MKVDKTFTLLSETRDVRIMAKIKITELGRKWYGVSVNFDNNDIERISPDVLRGLGGKLRYDTDGGLRALFHFNVTKQDNSEAMIKVLKYFGEDGYFYKGVDLTSSAASSICESDKAIKSVISQINKSCILWTNQWKILAETAVAKKLSRIHLLRKLSDMGLSHISEEKIREYTEELLRRKYKSSLFVETFMWRLGWPDKRKPFAAVQAKNTLNSAG